jgi:hypothetical protein
VKHHEVRWFAPKTSKSGKAGELAALGKLYKQSLRSPASSYFGRISGTAGQEQAAGVEIVLGNGGGNETSRDQVSRLRQSRQQRCP